MFKLSKTLKKKFQKKKASSPVSLDDTKIVKDKRLSIKKVKNGMCPMFGLCDPCLPCEILIVSSIISTLCGDGQDDCDDCGDSSCGCCNCCDGCCDCSCCDWLSNLFDCGGRRNKECYCQDDYYYDNDAYY